MPEFDPRDVLSLFIFMCGMGLGVIVGVLVGFGEGRRAQLIADNAELSNLHMRLFAGKAAAAEMEARARVGR